MSFRVPRFLALLVLVAVGATACRGQVSDKPPIHLVPDMDFQHRYDPLEESAFFADGRASRTPVEGTVPAAHPVTGLGGLKYVDDPEAFDAWYHGRSGDSFVAVAPITPNRADLQRGQERYDIYCAVCHDRTGAGNGLAVQRGFLRPINLADRLADMADGEIFHVISEGVRSMPSYAHQVPVEDRWKIVAWLRVLQRSQRATASDVPAGTRIANEVTQ